MRIRLYFGALLALSGAAGHAEAVPSPRLIFATVGHSEWCDPGTLRLRLETGRYTVNAPRSWRTCRRPRWSARTRTAVLAAADLASVRDAWQRVEAEGLDNPACRNGGQPDMIFVSNGGRQTLRLTRRGRTVAPPGDESCWSDAAHHLHDVLNRLFNPRNAERQEP